MLVRTMTSLGALILVACGRPSPTPVSEAEAPEPEPQRTEAAVTAVRDEARPMSFGIVYAGNMMGELEPCG